MLKFNMLNPDEKYEVIEIFDIPALFTNNRIYRHQIEDGFYLYHLRDDCEGNFCEIAYPVIVNHAGSIISKRGNALCGDMTLDDINFLGYEVTLREFMRRGFRIRKK